MNTRTINASVVSRMFLAGAKNLEAKKEWINELNVFPVPDGDTGTNMTMTIMSAASEVSVLENPGMQDLCKAISSGSLRGARGNSGVILSQLLRGFTRAVREKEELDACDLAAAMEKGVETAYKAVMKPKEGTILTVAKAASDRALEICEDTEDLKTFFEEILACAEEMLARTPDMLAVLKEAGVVDSGGQGLVEVYRGALDGFSGKEIDYTQFERPAAAPRINKETPQAEAYIKFGYCTECIILLNRPLTDDEEMEFKQFLNSIGDSIVLVADDEIVKLHVHTNHPGQVFEKGLTFGALSRIKVDNMRIEHQEKLFKDAERLAREQAAEDKKKQPQKDAGFIVVSSGDGLSEIFKELGVDYLIEGGQTMNPSTQDMLNAIEKVPARTIYVMPNNKNIIMAANQARDMTEDKEIIVVPTQTVPQGISALIAYQPELSGEENLKGMTEAYGAVKTGQVTYAVRDTRLNEKDIHEGDMMGIGDHGILAVGCNVNEVAKKTIKAMIDEDSEVISLYYGKEIGEDEANALRDMVEEAYPDCEIELNYGGQPVYYYIVSVE